MHYNEMSEFLIERNELMEKNRKGNINIKVKLASEDVMSANLSNIWYLHE
jgi:hypothetical protein